MRPGENAADQMHGKQVVITGATSGIGRAAALALGRRGANLLLVSRDRAAGTDLARRISAEPSAGRADFVETDLSCLAAVRAAAAQIRAVSPSIDVLINNAGARFDQFALTPEGTERTFATNHLGHFLLTGMLLDRLRQSPAARIITVTSSAAAQARVDGIWQFTDADAYERKQAYAKSKLANLMFAFELAHRLKSSAVLSLAVDPGIVATQFARNNGIIPWLKHLVAHGRRLELQSPSEGADTIVYLASTDRLAPNPSGALFRRRQLVPGCPAAYDANASADLWRLSTALTGVDPL